MPNLLERLKERKLIQWALTSAAVGWVALQVLDVVADPWGLSNGVVRGAQAALVVGFFVVLVLAWYHGEQGRQRVSGPELLIIGGLLVVSGLLYVSISAPGDSVTHEPTTAITADGMPAEAALVPLPSGPTVAVLPFTNMSGDPEQEFFSDGLSEDIITKLSRFKDLFVIARNSTFQYKGKAVDVRDVARELGARYVLEGSVRKAGTSLRVTAQLLDASDGTHLWAETYDRDLSASSIFAVQDEITEQVVGTIAGSGVISRARFAEIERKPPESLAGYECVLLAQNSGRYDTIRSEYRKKARSCLERTVRDDPGYTDAWAWLAWIDMSEHIYNPDASTEVLELRPEQHGGDPSIGRRGEDGERHDLQRGGYGDPRHGAIETILRRARSATRVRRLDRRPLLRWNGQIHLRGRCLRLQLPAEELPDLVESGSRPPGG